MQVLRLLWQVSHLLGPPNLLKSPTKSVLLRAEISVVIPNGQPWFQLFSGLRGSPWNFILGLGLQN